MKYLLAFSCRGRWFCPSCHAKKVIQFGEVLRENILYPVPHRQYVFSIPIILRKFFYNCSLLSDLAKCAADSLLNFLRTVLGLKDGICGAVMTIQVRYNEKAGSPTGKNIVFCSKPDSHSHNAAKKMGEPAVKNITLIRPPVVKHKIIF